MPWTMLEARLVPEHLYLIAPDAEPPDDKHQWGNKDLIGVLCKLCDSV